MNVVLTKDAKTLIVDHINFAKRHASYFYRKRAMLGFDLEDYEGAALLGLCDAARRFDPARGMLFQTFAYFRIKGAMFDLLREGGGIQRRSYNQIVKASKQQGERAATVDESGETSSQQVPYAFARSISELAGLMRTLDEVGLRVHKTLEGHAELSYADESSPEDIVTYQNGRKYLKRLIDSLPEKQRLVLELRYFSDYSFEEIGEQLGGLSKSWVSRIHTTGLDSLRELLIAEQKECRRRSDAAHSAV